MNRSFLIKAFFISFIYILLFYWLDYIRMNIWYSPLYFLLDHDLINIFIISFVTEMIINKDIKTKKIALLSICSYIFLNLLLLF